MPSREAELAAFYSRQAAEYEAMWAPELLSHSRMVVEQLDLAGARRIADVGAGVGTLLPILARAAPGALVVGVDLSEGMIRRAPSEYARAVMDARYLGLADDSLDAVLLAFVLFHTDPHHALREAARVLRPGGSVGALTWGEEPPYAASEVWNEELERHGAIPADEGFARFELVDGEAKLTALLKDARFTRIRSRVDQWVRALDPGEFIRHRTGHGQSRRRFESLDERTGTACLERVRRRLESLQPAAFVHRAEVIVATAEAPPGDGVGFR